MSTGTAIEPSAANAAARVRGATGAPLFGRIARGWPWRSRSASPAAATGERPGRPGAWAAALGLLAFAAQGQAQAPRSAADLDHFLGWFAGEFDNNEQVWQQAEDGVAPEDRHEHIHHIFLPVAAPAVGEHTFFVKQYMDGDYENVYRQRLYSFSVNGERGAIELAIHSFNDEPAHRYADRDPSVLEGVEPGDLRNIPGCNVYWRFVEDRYVGEMDDRACFYFSSNLGQNVYITDTLTLTEEEIRIGDTAYDEDGNRLFGRDEPHVNRKVRHFDGWAAVRRGSFEPDAAEPNEMLLVSGLRLHNEGQAVPLVTDAGDETGYALDLARLTYRNTRVAVLRLGVLDTATGETVAYSWADPDAGRIGINLGWMQAGLTAEAPER